MSRLDKTVTEGFIEIDLDDEHQLPKTMRLVLLAGTKGQGKEAGEKSKDENAEHVAFHYNYTLGEWGQIERLAPPKDAVKLIK